MAAPTWLSDGLDTDSIIENIILALRDKLPSSDARCFALRLSA